jgi:hypothetical protein
VQRYVHFDSASDRVISCLWRSFLAHDRTEVSPAVGDGDDARPLGEDWRLAENHLVLETTVDPGATRRTTVGRPDCPSDRLDELLDRPGIAVEQT